MLIMAIVIILATETVKINLMAINKSMRLLPLTPPITPPTSTPPAITPGQYPKIVIYPLVLRLPMAIVGSTYWTRVWASSSYPDIGNIWLGVGSSLPNGMTSICSRPGRNPECVIKGIPRETGQFQVLILASGSNYATRKTYILNVGASGSVDNAR